MSDIALHVLANTPESDQANSEKKEEEEVAASNDNTEVSFRMQAEIISLNLVDQRFTAVGHVTAEWPQPDVPEGDNIPYSQVSDKCILSPGSLLFLNGVENKLGESDTKIDCHDGKMVMNVGYEAELVEHVDVHRFPFDRQVISFQLQTMVDRTNLTFYEQENEGSWYSLMGGLSSEWKCCGPPALAVTRGTGDIPNVEMRVFLQRNPKYYLLNIVLPMFIIVGLALYVFALPVENLDARLSVILTLLLTAVAFKYVVVGFLPKVSYITLLDAYVTTAYSSLACVGTQSCLVYLYREDNDDINTIDRNCCIAFAAFWGAIHLLFLLGSIINVFYEPWPTILAKRKIALAKKTQAYTTSGERLLIKED